MTNTYQRVKNTLIELLNDESQKVIALKGKWGTGKTYLWRQVAAELFPINTKTPQPIYVSLFGVRSISELKLRIYQNSYNKNNAFFKSLVASQADKILSKFTGASLEDAAIMLLPKLASNNIIIIDDVERKHKSLDVDELFGFIDEFVEIHQTKFLILLNRDELNSDSSMWSTFHEKVIDAEVTLDPTPGEAFEIAGKSDDNHIHQEIKIALTVLNVNNIRIIQKVILLVDKISNLIGANETLVSHWVPSTVLLVASHFKATTNLPPLDYIKKFNSFEHIFSQTGNTRTDDEILWDKILSNLNIQEADNYETIIDRYLQLGILDTEGLKSLFEKYSLDQINSVAVKNRTDFYTAVYWGAHNSVGDLEQMANSIIPDVSSLDAGAITDMVTAIDAFGKPELSRKFLNEWLKTVDTRDEFKNVSEIRFDEPYRSIHPEVLDKINQLREAQYPPLTILEAIDRIAKNSGWGSRESGCLGRSTVQDYLVAIRQLNGAPLRRFLTQHTGWIRSGAHDDNFRNAVNNFEAACKDIYSADPNSRISTIMLRQFKADGLEVKLTNA